MNDPQALLASGHRFIASVSGGKDSGAMCLHLRERGIPFEPVFMDTGWELPETYGYLRDTLPKHIGEIRWLRAEVTLDPVREAYAQELEGMLGHYSAMVRWCLKKNMTPKRLQRWCTERLKLNPMLAWMSEQDGDIVSCVGVRGEESKARAAMSEWEWSDRLDGWTWRPLHRWSFDDVIAVHARHGVRPNPAYLSGALRVGCAPCIFARKEEIRWLADTHPNVIAVVRRMEEILTPLTEAMMARNGRTMTGTSTWFQADIDEDSAIDKVVEWSQTSRGGKQVELFMAPPRDAGCMRWGMCDTGSTK